MATLHFRNVYHALITGPPIPAAYAVFSCFLAGLRDYIRHCLPEIVAHRALNGIALQDTLLRPDRR